MTKSCYQKPYTEKALSLVHQNHWGIEPHNPVYMLWHPWEYLYAELCGPFPTGEYIFAVIDAYSRFSEAVLLKNTFSKSFIKELESIFSRHGFPVILKTGSGPNLASAKMENYLHSKGIHHAKSASYWPRNNIEAERYNRTLLKSICVLHAEGKDWRSYFNSVLLDYR